MKQTIRLNEAQLKRVVAESVKKILNERFNEPSYDYNINDLHTLETISEQLGDIIGRTDYIDTQHLIEAQRLIDTFVSKTVGLDKK